jgi:hypothetical protein
VVEVGTSVALKILRVSPSDWRSAKDKGLYTCAPPTRNGKRTWTLDDLVCLAWYDALCATGMPRPLAGGMADELSKAIARQPSAPWFNVYAWERDGERGGLSIGSEPPSDAPNAQMILVVPVTQWRCNVRAAVKNFYDRRDARARR